MPVPQSLLLQSAHLSSVMLSIQKKTFPMLFFQMLDEFIFIFQTCVAKNTHTQLFIIYDFNHEATVGGGGPNGPTFKLE